MFRDATGKPLVIFAAAAAVIGALVWMIVRDRRSQPYSVARTNLSGWTIVQGSATDAWVVGLRPPASLSAALIQQVAEKSGLRLVAPERPALPLVMREEYETALQGVYGVDAILRRARNAGIENAVFEPVCLAHRRDPRDQRELFFVAFTSREFYDLREDLVPPEPEHAGVGVYEPAALSPLLPVGATSSDVAHLWPALFDAPTDCQAQLLVK